MTGGRGWRKTVYGLGLHQALAFLYDGPVSPGWADHVVTELHTEDTTMDAPADRVPLVHLESERLTHYLQTLPSDAWR